MGAGSRGEADRRGAHSSRVTAVLSSRWRIEMGQPTDAFMDACRRWADDTGQPAYAAASFVLLFLGGDYPRRGGAADVDPGPSTESAALSAADRGDHYGLDHVRDRIERLIGAGVKEEWLIASLVAAIADVLDDASDAVHRQARGKRIGAEIRALETDAERRQAFIEGLRPKLADDDDEATTVHPEAEFDTWLASSNEILRPMSLEEWMDRLWLARRWRDLSSSLTRVSALLDRQSPFSLR
jgi:hypothetical protein